MTAFHKPCEPGMFSFPAVFDLPIFGQLFLTIEERAAIHDAVMMSNSKQVIGYVFVFPLTGVPFAYKNAAVGAVKILWFVCHDGAFGFVVIVNGDIRLNISGIFQNAGKFHTVKIDAAGRKGTAADQNLLYICQTGIRLGVCIKNLGYDFQIRIGFINGGFLAIQCGTHQIEAISGRTAAPGAFFDTGIIVIPDTFSDGFTF